MPLSLQFKIVVSIVQLFVAPKRKKDLNTWQIVGLVDAPPVIKMRLGSRPDQNRRKVIINKSKTNMNSSNKIRRTFREVTKKMVKV